MANGIKAKPTVREVAEVAGVSQRTVCRILNGTTGLHRAATCDHVLAAAAQLGYRRIAYVDYHTDPSSVEALHYSAVDRCRFFWRL